MVGSNGFRTVPKTVSAQKPKQNRWVPWWVPVGSAWFRKVSVARSPSKTGGFGDGFQWVPHGSEKCHWPEARAKQAGSVLGSNGFRQETPSNKQWLQRLSCSVSYTDVASFRKQVTIGTESVLK